jgi:GNAT superfamily N-acetyltransferase
VRPIGPDDRDWVRGVLSSSWGSPFVVSPAGGRDAAELAGLVAISAGEPAGLVTYAIDDDHGCEIVTLDAFVAGRGVGTALLDAVRDVALAAGCKRLWLATTNDNTAALRFYQRRGWDLIALHRDVLREWRRIKPSIPELGRDAIPLRHALELELRLVGDTV